MTSSFQPIQHIVNHLFVFASVALGRVYGLGFVTEAREAIDHGHLETLVAMFAQHHQGEETPTEAEKAVALMFREASIQAYAATYSAQKRTFFARVSLKGRIEFGLCQVTEELRGGRRHRVCAQLTADDPHVEHVWEDTCWRMTEIPVLNAMVMLAEDANRKRELRAVETRVNELVKQKFGAQAIVVAQRDCPHVDTGNEYAEVWGAVVWADGRVALRLDKHEVTRQDAYEALERKITGQPAEVDPFDDGVVPVDHDELMNAMRSIYLNAYADQEPTLDGAKIQLHAIQTCAARFVDTSMFRPSSFVAPPLEESSDAAGFAVVKSTGDKIIESGARISDALAKMGEESVAPGRFGKTHRGDRYDAVTNGVGELNDAVANDLPDTMSEGSE